MTPDLSTLAALLIAASPPSSSAQPQIIPMLPVAQNAVSSRRTLDGVQAIPAALQSTGEPPLPPAGPVVVPPVDPAQDPAPAEPGEGEPESSLPADAPPAGDEFEGNVIVVEGMTEAPPGDPLFQLNADVYESVQSVDQALVQPIADVYEDGLPRPLRKGLSNLFSNLREPIAFLNFLLQGKIGKAAETVGRFAINSTLGLAGLVDVAKKEPFNLPRRNNGFANTLGFYGVDSGAFLYLPLIGPTTVRDLVGNTLDTLVMPAAFGDPFNRLEFAATSYTVRALDERIELEEKHSRIADSDFPYATMRETYLCERQRAIDTLRNRPLAECTPEALSPLPDAASVTAPAE